MAQLKSNTKTILTGITPWEELFHSNLNFSATGLLKDFRERSFKNFLESGFPSSKNESWKYTSLAALLKKKFSLADSEINKQTESGPKDTQSNIISKANILVFRDGRYQPGLSVIIDKDSVQIAFLSDLQEVDKNKMLETYFSTEEIQRNSLESLHSALSAEPVILKVKKNAKPLFPFVIIQEESKGKDATISFGGMFVQALENSSIDLIEFQKGPIDHDTWSWFRTEIEIGAGASVRHLVLQNESSKGSIYNRTKVEVGSSANYQSWVISLGGEIVRNDLEIEFRGEYAEALLKGLYLLNGNSHIDNHTRVDHAVPNCHSNELYKGAIDGEATGVFNGKIFVRPDAQKTTAYQSNKNLLLSSGAQVNTKPQLEIFADDVKCSHGATTGRLDENAMFYLRSRGISESRAKSLLTAAFAAEITESLPWEEARNFLAEKIQQRLEF